ncbi:MAG: tetratricopeptide repeat protein [Candidatus Zixiibacteriota bacterium]|jgi:tetratricopeptide (TPR) repeat protein
MVTVFGKGRWMYWSILVAVGIAAAIIIARRRSPEEIARTRLIWGDQAMEAQEYDQAIAFYRVAVEKDPTLLTAYFNLALAYEFVDDEKALAAWEEYLKVAAADPSQDEWVGEAEAHRGRLRARPHFARAAELSEAENYEGARKEYSAALKYTPEDLDILRGAAENEAAAGDYEAAIGYYEAALEVAPYSMNIRYDLAQVYENTDKNKAVALYEELLNMSATHTGIKPSKLKDAQKRHLELRREGYHG